MIEPPLALGAMRSSAFANSEQVADWIEAGRQAAAAVLRDNKEKQYANLPDLSDEGASAPVVSRRSAYQR